MNDARSLENASMDTSTGREQRDHDLSPLEESYEDYSAPPEVSPIHSLRHSSVPAYAEGSHQQSRRSAGAGWEERGACDRPRSQTSSPPTSVHAGDSDLASSRTCSSCSPSSLSQEESSLNFSKQYRRARALASDDPRDNNNNNHAKNCDPGHIGDTSSALFDASGNMGGSGTASEEKTKPGGFLQLSLRKYKTEVEKADHYARSYEQARQATDKKKKQQLQEDYAKSVERPRRGNEVKEKSEDAAVALHPVAFSVSSTKTAATPARNERLARGKTGATTSHDDSSTLRSTGDHEHTTASPPPRPVRDPRKAKHTERSEASAAVFSVHSVRDRRSLTNNSVPALTYADAVDGTDAFTRLYVEAQNRERRLERHREQVSKDREKERRASCSFRPSHSPWQALRPSPVAPSLTEKEKGDAPSADKQREQRHDENGGTRSLQSTSRERSRPYTDFGEFLQAQNDHETRRKENLRAAARKMHETEAPGLLQSVPPSSVRDKMAAYLVKEKSYVDPVTGWQERFQAYMETKEHGRRHPVTRGTGDTPLSARGERKNSQGATPGSSRKSCTASVPVNTRGSCRPTDGIRSPNGNGDATATKPTSDTVFDRLYHESSTRATTRHLLTLMQIEHESQQFFQPNRENGFRTAPTTPRVPAGQATRKDDESSVDSALLSSHSAESHNNVHDVRIPKAGSNHARPSVFEELYAEKDEIARRREVARMEAEEEEDTFSFQPYINPRSRELIVERAQAIARGEREASFVQQTSPPASQIPHYRTQYNRSERRKGQLGQMRSASATDPCAPAGDGTTRRCGSSNSRHRHAKVDDNIAEEIEEAAAEAFNQRVALFAQRRQARLAAARRREDIEQLQECTFRPNLSLISRAMASSASRTRGTDATPPASVSSATASAAHPPLVVEEAALADDNQSYVQLMATPEVTRTLWKGATRHATGSGSRHKGRQTVGEGSTTPHHRPPALSVPEAKQAASSQRPKKLHRQRTLSSASTADFSTPARVRASDPTPAGHLPLDKLLPATALEPEYQVAPRVLQSPAMSIDVGCPTSPSAATPSQGHGGGGSDQHPYFRTGAFYCENDDDVAPSPAATAFGGGLGDHGDLPDTAGPEDTPPMKKETLAAVEAGDTAPSALGRERRVSWTDGDLTDPLTDPLDGKTPPLTKRKEHRRHSWTHAEGREGPTGSTPARDTPFSLTGEGRPPLSPHRRIDYGLAGVHGTDSATSAELNALEKELRGVMDEWAERLQTL